MISDFLSLSTLKESGCHLEQLRRATGVLSSAHFRQGPGGSRALGVSVAEKLGKELPPFSPQLERSLPSPSFSPVFLIPFGVSA